MPIHVNGNLSRLTQPQFALISYAVMNEAFSIYEEFGSLFDEAVYREALVDRLEDAVAEVQVDVTFQDFRKSYFIDIVASGGGIFELKAVKKLNANHRNQLMNYLLLTEMAHGKLINFGGEQVEHEFVNATLTQAERRNFSVDSENWTETDGFGKNEMSLICELLREWGTGLDRTLYRDAVFHFLGGKDQLMKKMDVWQNGIRVAQQLVPLCSDSTILHLTTFQNDNSLIGQQLIRLMRTARIGSAQWINVSRKMITFKTLNFSVPNFSV